MEIVIMFRIYFSSAAGLDYTGISCSTEKEAKELCDKYNKQDGNNPYGKHIYVGDGKKKKGNKS